MPRRKVITVAPKGKRYIFARSFGLWQSEKDGRPVLVIERHWSKISGIWINTRWGCVWVRLRRFGAR